MFGNFSMPELLIVGALALIVIGPKDLPRMMRSIGQFVGQARGLARQFQRSMDDAARELDVQEFKEAKKLMNSPAGVDDFAKPFKEKIGFDDKDDAKAKKTASIASKPDETARKSDAAKEAAAEPVKPSLVKAETQPSADPDPVAAPAAAEAKQG